MYKVKESSGKNVIIKFSKQSEVNYQSVCVMNEVLNRSCLLPFDFQIKLFKIHLTYDCGDLMRLSDILKGQSDFDTLSGIIGELFNTISAFSSTGLDVNGLVLSPECIFVNAAGQIKLVYAPAFTYESVYSLDSFVNGILKAKASDAMLCNCINQCYSAFTGKPFGMENGVQASAPQVQSSVFGAPDQDFAEGETTVLSAQPAPAQKPDFSEGETTVLSAQPSMPKAQPAVYQAQPRMPDFSEGETTVLSAQPSMPKAQPAVYQAQPMMPDFSEGETTVLSAQPSMSKAQPAVYQAQPMMSGFSEGETTVLSAQPSMPKAQPAVYQAQPQMSGFSEGETTILSADNSPFAASAADDDDDFYNENATCLIIDSDFGDNASNSSFGNEPAEIPDAVPDIPSQSNGFDYNQNLPEEDSGDFSENETAYPHVGHPLNSDRTLIGSEGLAQAMAYSAIQANSKAADSYETVLLVDENIDKTAFFIRFINSQAVYVTKNYFTIGSGSDMDYMISGNSLISKYHATVVIEDGRFFIIDNNSTNKVYVDGREAAPLEKNEIFTGSRVVLANEIFDFYIK